MGGIEFTKEKNKKQMVTRHRKSRSRMVSFSARLPSDVRGVWAENSICAVLYSTDPMSDVRDSIIEMIREVGVCNWDDMEELVYCYLALNSSEVHNFISQAFLSLFS